MIQHFIKDVMKYLPAQIVPALLGFISIPIITRIFSTSDYGNYTLVLTTTSILAIIVGWINMSVIRFYQTYESKNRTQEFSDNVFNITIFSVISLMIIYLGALLLLKNHIIPELMVLLLVGTLYFGLNSIFQTFQYWLRAKLMSSWYTAFSLFCSIVGLGLGLVIIYFHSDISGLLWGSIIAFVVSMPFLTIKAMGVKLHFGFKYISSKVIKELAQYGFPLVVGNLATWILTTSDRYLIGFYRNTSEVGIYSASNNISESSILLIATLVTLSAGPLGMRIWEQQGEQKSREFVTQVTRYYLLIAIPAVIGIGALAEPLVKVMTSAAYYEGYRIMLLVAASGFFIGLTQRFITGLQYYKKTTHVMYGTIAAGLLNLGLNIWLVPVYGYMAAAINTLISTVFLFIYMVFISRKYFVWDFPFKSLIKISIASILMGVFIYFLSHYIHFSVLISLICCIFAGVVIYIIILFLFKEFEKDEISIIKNLTGKVLRYRKIGL